MKNRDSEDNEGNNNRQDTPALGGNDLMNLQTQENETHNHH